MTKLFDLVGFAAQMSVIDRDLEAVGPAIVAKAAEMIANKARAQIGKPHPGIWPPLAESTKEDRARHGYAPNEPLLRTGELRDSIAYIVHGNEACVGSDSPIAVYQELGTSHIPPRSFLVSSAVSMEERIHKMAGRAVVAALEGRGLHASEIAELFHALREAGHAIKENLIDPLLDPDEGDDR